MNKFNASNLDQLSKQDVTKNKPSEADPFIDSRSAHYNITKDTEPPSNWQCILVMILNLAIIISLFVVVFVEIWIAYPTHRHATLSTAGRVAYVTCTTALATLISTITSSQIKMLWFWKLSRDASGHRQIPTLLGIGRWKKHFRYWPISLSSIMTGLMTTSIVAAIVPSESLVPIPGSVEIAPGSRDTVLPGAPDNGIDCTFTDNSSISGPWNWQLAAGNYLHIYTSCLDAPCTPYCEYTSSVTLLSRLVPTNPEVKDFSPANMSTLPIYSISGNVNVLPSALGVLLDFDIDRVPLGSVPALTDPSLWETASVCLPVFASNPVSCTVAGDVAFETPLLNVTAPLCNATQLINTNDLNFTSSSPAAASRICTGGPPGRSTIVMGAINEYASLLAEMMLNLSVNSANSSYSVQCTVDIPSSLSYRSVFLNNHNLSATTTSACTPYSEPAGEDLQDDLVITPDKLAFASAGLAQILAENQWHDGAWNSLFSAFVQRFPSPGWGNTTDHRQPFAFSDSKNYLEDLLGVATSMVWGEHLVKTVDTSTLLVSSGVVEAWGVKVGAARKGKRWAVVYVLPQLYAGGLLAWLFWGKLEKEERRRVWKMTRR